MKDTRVMTVATVVLAGCALVVTLLVVKREIGWGKVTAPPLGGTEVVVPAWEKYVAAGHHMGPTDAKIKILEFADFECPYCARFASITLKALRRQHPNDIEVIFRHWPLSYHRFALPSARAAECAAAQDRFEGFYQILYEHQDSLGLKSYAEFAQAAGVPDIEAFTACNRQSGPIPSVDADTQAVRTLGATGTPTVIVNGIRFVGVPDSIRLARFIDSTLKANR